METEKRNALIEFRKNEKKTQREMANVLEISLIQYQFLETGRRNPSYNLLKKFKKIFPRANVNKIFLL